MPGPELGAKDRSSWAVSYFDRGKQNLTVLRKGNETKMGDFIYVFGMVMSGVEKKEARGKNSSGT